MIWIDFDQIKQLQSQLQIYRMKTQQYRTKLQEELSENYNICLMLQRQSTTTLKYEQILYIIFSGRIPMPKIAYFKKKKYRSQQPSIRKQAILQDALKLKQEVINKAWRFQKAQDVDRSVKNSLPRKQSKPTTKTDDKDQQNQTIQNAQQKQSQENDRKKQAEVQQQLSQKKGRSQTTKQKDHRQLKARKQNLQQTLIILQGKLISSRSEEEAAGYQKQYYMYAKQLNFLRNKKRVEQEENLLKRIASQTSETVPEKIINLLHQMGQIKNKNSKILHKQPSYQEKLPKTEQISRINLIFSHYSKKQATSNNRYFSDLQKEHNKLPLQTFIKFAHDWQLDRIITFEQIVTLFKARSKGNRFVDSLKFSEILADIHSSECIKEERPINNESTSQYMQQYIVCDQKINRFIMNSDKNTKRQDSVQYKFKPKNLSGKYLHDITQELQARKRTVDFLAGPRNIDKIKERQVQTRNYTLQNSRVDQTSKLYPGQASFDTIQNASNVNLNDSVNSYAFRFKLKNTKSRIKTQGIIKSIQNNQTKNQALIKALEANRENINVRNQSRYQSSQSKKNFDIQNQIEKEKKEDEDEDKFIDKVMNNKKKKSVPFEGFQDLIEESSEDQYLNKHLLPPIQSKRLARHIHY